MSDLDLIATTAMATRVEAPSHHWAGFSVVSFNFGMQQNRITPGKNASRHLDKLVQIFNVFGDEINAHSIFGCEMGGHQPNDDDLTPMVSSDSDSDFPCKFLSSEEEAESLSSESWDAVD